MDHGGAQRPQELTIEVRNCMAGAEWAMENQHHTVAVGCTIAAANVWLHTGPFAAGASLVERCLQIDALPAIDRHRLHQILGELWSVAGHGSISLPHLNTALKLAKSPKDLWLESNVLNHLGDILLKQGHLYDARQLLILAIDFCEEAFPVPAGAFMGSLALVESQEGRIPSALKILDQAESLIGSSNQQERAKLLCKRGRVLRMVPDANRAIESLREAEQIQQAIEAGDESELGKAVNELRRVLHNPASDGI